MGAITVEFYKISVSLILPFRRNSRAQEKAKAIAVAVCVARSSKVRAPEDDVAQDRLKCV